MKSRIFSAFFLTVLSSFLIIAGYRCAGTKNTAETAPSEIIKSNINGTGVSIQIDFLKGESHNHPLMAIWLEDMEGKYIETLYIAESIGKGIFQHGDKSNGEWQAGPIRRPAALPYWGHQRGIQAADGYFIPTPEDPMPDAVTGPTPSGNFILQSKSGKPTPGSFKLLFEINQSWDWNSYWTNTKYPEDINYMSSSQPSLVYGTTIDLNSSTKEYLLTPIGHGHYSGFDGSLNTDLSTMTTALQIAKSIRVQID